MALQFSLSSEGEKAELGNQMVKVSKESITIVIGLPKTWELWFKKQTMTYQDCKLFLNWKFYHIYWTKGTLCSCLENEWAKPLVELQKYLTCEGRYGITFLYHIRILWHFKPNIAQLNFPYFFLKSLCKMVALVRINF